MKTSVRCFAKNRSDGKSRGVWLMTEEKRGAFYHGDRDEVQKPLFYLSELASYESDGIVEITPEQAIEELKDRPNCQGHAKRAMARHP